MRGRGQACGDLQAQQVEGLAQAKVSTQGLTWRVRGGH